MRVLTHSRLRTLEQASPVEAKADLMVDVGAAEVLDDDLDDAEMQLGHQLEQLEAQRVERAQKREAEERFQREAAAALDEANRQAQ